MVGVVSHFVQRQTLVMLSKECGECRLQICAEKEIFYTFLCGVGVMIMNLSGTCS